MFDKEMNYIAFSKRWLEDNKVSEFDLICKCHYDIVPLIPDRWEEIHQRISRHKLRTSHFPRSDFYCA